MELNKFVPHVIALFLFCISQTLNAQVRYTSLDIRLDTAVHHYNRFRDLADSYDPKISAASRFNEVIDMGNSVAGELQSIMRGATGMQKEVAEYFYYLTQFKKGYVYGVNGNFSESYTLLTPLSTYFITQSESTFPKKYLFEGKNYAISYENFAPTQLNYYATLTELYLYKKEYASVFDWALMAGMVNYTDGAAELAWDKYVAFSKYIDASKESGIYPDGALEAGVRFLEYYAALSRTEKLTVGEYNYPSNRSGYQYLVLISDKKATFNDPALWVRAAQALIKCEDQAAAAECYMHALDAGLSDYTVFTEIYAFAAGANNRTLGLKACATEEPLIGDGDCAGFSELASHWRQFGDTDKAQATEAKAADCAEVAARQQAEAEKQERKRTRKYNRDFSLFAGIYPLPLLTLDNTYRDYGGVVGFGLYNFSMEFSYKYINRNIVTMEDLAFNEIDSPEERILWDGYRAHVALKFGERDGSDDDMFVGPLFEIADKSFVPLGSAVFDANGVYITDAMFYPKELSYNGYLNFGMHLEENHFMFDYFFGIGASYSRFDVGNSNFDRDAFDFSNTLLQNRKPERWGPLVRFGITLGLTTKD